MIGELVSGARLLYVQYHAHCCISIRSLMWLVFSALVMIGGARPKVVVVMDPCQNTDTVWMIMIVRRMVWIMKTLSINMMMVTMIMIKLKMNIVMIYIL